MRFGMKQDSRSNYDNFLHPVVFVLKEGEAIKKNYLDYSLLLLQMGQGDVLKSPPKPSQNPSNPAVQLLKK